MYYLARRGRWLSSYLPSISEERLWGLLEAHICHHSVEHLPTPSKVTQSVAIQSVELQPELTWPIDSELHICVKYSAECNESFFTSAACAVHTDSVDCVLRLDTGQLLILTKLKTVIDKHFSEFDLNLKRVIGI